MKLKKIKGFTLIETLVVVSVFLALVTISLQLYRSIKNNINLNIEIGHIDTIYVNLNKAFSDIFDNYDEKFIDSTYLIKSRSVPKNLVYNKERDVFINSFGGDVEIKNSSGKGFQVTMKGVPTLYNCTKLAKSQEDKGWSSIEINSRVFNGSVLGKDFYKACSDKASGNVIKFEKSWGIRV